MTGHAAPAASAAEVRAPLLRLLIVDHFDSYTLNLLSLLSSVWPNQAISGKESDNVFSSHIVVLAHTHPLLATQEAIRNTVLPHIDAIILSPGPGTPHSDEDFGAGSRLLSIIREQAYDVAARKVPVLGVCLGHQGMAAVLGAKVQRAKSILHGVKSKLIWPSELNAAARYDRLGQDLFAGVKEGCEVVRYNSLTVDPSCEFALRQANGVHNTHSFMTALNEETQVLAWGWDQPNTFAAPIVPSSFPVNPPSRRSTPAATPSLSHANSPVFSGLGVFDRGEKVILALRHRKLPWWGVQFHPESIDSSGGEIMLANWLTMAEKVIAAGPASESGSHGLPSFLRMAGRSCIASADLNPSNLPSAGPSENKRWQLCSTRFRHHSDRPDFEVLQDVFETLATLGNDQDTHHRTIWLDSARKSDPHSRWSYIAVPDLWLSHCSRDSLVKITPTDCFDPRTSVQPQQTLHMPRHDSWWHIIEQVQRLLQAGTVDGDSRRHGPGEQTSAVLNPFTVGLIGYFGYGMRHESLLTQQERTVPPQLESRIRQDSELAFCSRVLAFDHKEREWHAHALVQTGIGPRKSIQAKNVTVSTIMNRTEIGVPSDSGESWFRIAAQTTKAAGIGPPPKQRQNEDLSSLRLPLMRPIETRQAYLDKVQACRLHIAAGESYELCLTTEFRGQMDTKQATVQDHYRLYKGLRKRNAAPYSAFMPLPSLLLQRGEPPAVRTICSTSPERFMRVTRRGQVEMKPIKGTVPRAGFRAGEEEWRAGTCTCAAGTTCSCHESVKASWRSARDAERRAALVVDIKERAENLMVSLGRLR